MLWLPTAKAAVLYVACPAPLSVALPRVMAPSWKVRMPVAVPARGRAAASAGRADRCGEGQRFAVGRRTRTGADGRRGGVRADDLVQRCRRAGGVGVRWVAREGLRRRNAPKITGERPDVTDPKSN